MRRAATIFLLTLCGAAAPAWGQVGAAGGVLAAGEGAADAGGRRPLVVGTKQAPPFSMQDPATGEWSGLSIELWRDVARELDRDYRLEERDLPGLLAGLEDGSLDVAVAALTVTAAREARMDFSHPFHTSGLGIAVRSGGRGGGWALLRSLLSPRLLGVIGGLALLLALVGACVWWLERRRNPDFQGGSAWAGLGHAFWWSAVTMTTVGYGDKTPRTAAGRTVALLWMFASVVLISGFTAAIASSLTLANLAGPVAGPEDLPGVVVATVSGSTSLAYLEGHGIRHREYPTLAGALAAVAEGSPVCAVYDAPLLRYLVQHGGPRGGRWAERIEVLPQVFERQDYAFGLPQGSPLREPINRLLLEEIVGDDWRERVTRYVGER